ncbi:MAG: hypothetical protein FWF01_03970 [Alphaproteobacteria bacterium]|nr:hypothetical protein [Alphaproteobacteria bacterium]
MKKLLALIAVFLVTPAKAFAVNPACVMCAITIGTSLAIAQKLGVDDNIVAVWGGALLAILGMLIIKYFDKKGWNFWGRDPIIMVSCLSGISAMYVKQLTYTPRVVLWFLYIDTFLLASLFGAAAVMLSLKWYEWMKERRGGKPHFPFEKVVLPLVAVLLVAVAVGYLMPYNCAG